jgi:hypothetical protein
VKPRGSLETVVIILLLMVVIAVVGRAAHQVCVVSHPDAPAQCEFPS